MCQRSWGGAVDVADTCTAAPVAGGDAASMVGGTDSVRRASELVPAGLTIGIPVSDSGGGIVPSELMPVPKTIA